MATKPVKTAPQAKEEYPMRTVASLNMSVGNFSRRAQPEAESEGVTTRGNGAATKGTKARGPMA